MNHYDTIREATRAGIVFWYQCLELGDSKLNIGTNLVSMFRGDSKLNIGTNLVSALSGYSLTPKVGINVQR